MLGNWFETYAWALQLNVWTRAEFTGATYDEAAGCWKAVVRRADGSERILSPHHIIFADGVSGLPRIPSLPGLDAFAGEVVHSHSFTEESPWRGKKVLVLGTGNGGHDIAQELHSSGADTTIIQRGSTTVVTVDPSAKLNYALYDEGPLDDCDLLASANTYPLVVKGYQLAVERIVEFDKEIHVKTHAAGGPVVHRRRPRAMPHLFEIPRAADQGARRRPDAEAIGLLVRRFKEKAIDQPVPVARTSSATGASYSAATRRPPTPNSATRAWV